MKSQHRQFVDTIVQHNRPFPNRRCSHINMRVMAVEQKGTNNNHGFPVHIANRTDKTTPAHHDKQKPQLNIFAKKSLP